MRVGTDLLIGDVFRNAARAVPDRLAAVVGEQSLTFDELDRAANRMARAVAALGVARGDRVVVWSGTHLEVMPLFVALAKLGAAFAPINNTWSAEEAAPVVTSADPALLVVDDDHAAAGLEVAAVAGCALATLADIAVVAGDDADYVDPDLDERDTHVVFFTSGSTGCPRASCSRTASTSCAPTPVCCPSRAAQPCARTRCSTWARGRSRCSSGRLATTSCSRPPMRSRSATRWRSSRRRA